MDSENVQRPMTRFGQGQVQSEVAEETIPLTPVATAAGTRADTGCAISSQSIARLSRPRRALGPASGESRTAVTRSRARLGHVRPDVIFLQFTPDKRETYAMAVFIESIDIRRFRAFKELGLTGLGKVNLVTGKNNSGKSTLLEAIRVLATGGSTRTLYEILDYREELDHTDRDSEQAYAATDVAPICNLFNGFPALATIGPGFSISATGQLPALLRTVSLRMDWFIRRADPDRRTFSYEPAQPELFDDVDSFPALVLEVSGRSRIVPLDRLGRRRYPMRPEAETAQMPCVHLDPFSSQSTRELGPLWDAIALTDAEDEVLKALQVISSDIQAISVIGSDARNPRPRTAIAKSTRYTNRVPLRTFGDGVNRLFGIVLSLCNARNGILLVDEVENGLHYSVQRDVWRAIFRLATDLNVQVFATSHSWDCVRAFQEAASESPQEGVLVRLSQLEDRILPTVFREKDLEIVTRDHIEVR